MRDDRIAYFNLRLLFLWLIWPSVILMFSASFMNWYYSKRPWSVSVRYRLGELSLNCLHRYIVCSLLFCVASLLCVHLTPILSLGIIYTPRGKGWFYALVPENEVHEDNTLCPRFFLRNHPPTFFKVNWFLFQALTKWKIEIRGSRHLTRLARFR